MRSLSPALLYQSSRLLCQPSRLLYPFRVPQGLSSRLLYLSSRLLPLQGSRASILAAVFRIYWEGVPRRACAPRPAWGPPLRSLSPAHQRQAKHSRTHCKAQQKTLQVALLYFGGEETVASPTANSLLLLCCGGCRGPAGQAVQQSAQQNNCLLYVLMCFCKECTAAVPEPNSLNA